MLVFVEKSSLFQPFNQLGRSTKNWARTERQEEAKKKNP